MRPIEVRRNGSSCIIRWSYQGKRYSITHGTWDLQPGSKLNVNVEKLRLENCGKLIATDIALNEFDTSLSKYNYYLLGVLPPEVPKLPQPIIPIPEKPSVIQLVEQRLSERYSAADDVVLRLLKYYNKPINTPEDAKAFIKWLDSRNVKDSTKKRYLNTLRAIRKDLFGSFNIKVAEKPAPKPFSKSEVARILNYLQIDKYYSWYYPFILFLFNTGARTSEGIGLLWRDVDLEKKEIHIYANKHFKDSALISASQKQEDSQELMILEKNVPTAEQLLQLTNTPEYSSAPVTALNNTERLARVYTIEVQDAHCYFVKSGEVGFLVSNCDSLRYILASLEQRNNLLK